MVRQLSSDGSLTPDVAAHIMTSVLQALQLHGQHESNLGSLLVLGAQLYEILRPSFPNIVEVCAACAFMNIIINHIQGVSRL
jgi:exportin-5